MWDIAIELKTRIPELDIICDPSHITGTRDLIAFVAQKALDLDMVGLMIESHINPDAAWSDAAWSDVAWADAAFESAVYGTAAWSDVAWSDAAWADAAWADNANDPAVGDAADASTTEENAALAALGIVDDTCDPTISLCTGLPLTLTP